MLECNLNESEFIDTNLNKLDLSNCKIEGIIVNPNNVRGLTVNMYQAVDLALLLGIKIK